MFSVLTFMFQCDSEAQFYLFLLYTQLTHHFQNKNHSICLLCCNRITFSKFTQLTHWPSWCKVFQRWCSVLEASHQLKQNTYQNYCGGTKNLFWLKCIFLLLLLKLKMSCFMKKLSILHNSMLEVNFILCTASVDSLFLNGCNKKTGVEIF